MFRAPSMAGLPSFDQLMADLPATPEKVARHLGISPRTMRNYMQAGAAPRPVMLALFWETRWGRSAADCEAANFAAIHYRRAQSAERQNVALTRQIAALEGELAKAGTGAANGPIFKLA